jgi:hypothetical protein
MSVQSQALYNGAVANAECLKCWQQFSDPTGAAPCPNCGEEARIRALSTEKAKAEKTSASSPVAKAGPSKRGMLGIHWDRAPIVLLGLLILGLWWMTGGRYTIDGLPLVFNEAAKFFRLSVRLPPVTNGMWYAALCWLPILISLSESRHSPRARIRRALQGQKLTVGGILSIVFTVVIAWVTLVWFIVSALDAGSTWLAIRNPPSDAYTVSKQVAALPLLAGIWTAATTFLPEMGIVALWRWLRE